MTFQPIGLARPRAGPVETTGPPAYGAAYGWLTPAIEAIAAHHDGFAARVLHIPREELHFIALIVALMGDKARDADHLAAFAREYGYTPRRKLAAKFSFVIPDEGVAKLAPKIAGSLWRAPTYVRMAALFHEENARKVLRHCKSISRRTVLTLSRLPAEYRTQGVLKMIKRPRELGEVLFAIELVRRVRTDLNDVQIVASLEKAETPYIREWVMKHYEHAPFPEAPTGPLIRGGVDVLRPLSSHDDLARAAREFENCIRTYLWQVLKGDSYFYRYAPEAGGKGVAIVELRRAPIVGWVVHEALGPGNDPINGAHRAAIIAAFRDEGVGAAPQAVNPNGPWFDV